MHIPYPSGFGGDKFLWHDSDREEKKNLKINTILTTLKTTYLYWRFGHCRMPTTSPLAHSVSCRNSLPLGVLPQQMPSCQYPSAYHMFWVPQMQPKLRYHPVALDTH
eukprot:6206468-Pleurochrysis_carterae.AAC.2